MSPRIFRPPSDRLRQRWSSATLPQDEAPHFLSMMVRARARRICWRNRAGPAGQPMSRESAADPPRRSAMSLKPSPIEPVPGETARVARAAFRKGNPLLKLRDELGAIFADADFADLFPERGRPGLAPWRLALVTLLQFREDLSDRRAAEAVRARIDWKYLLGLELDDPGFDASVLCEFRARLLEGAAEERLLDRLLARCRELGLLKARGRQRSDTTHELAAIRTLNRLELVGETLR